MNQLVLDRNKDAKLHWHGGGLYSMTPPETMFGYTVHAHMIPPFEPEYGLILGSSGGTVTKLIKKIYPDASLDCVDKESRPGGEDDSSFYLIDAKEFISRFNYPRFDFICIDLWNGAKVCDLIYDPEFATKIAQICNGLMCMNIPSADADNAIVYHDAGFEYDRHVNVDANSVIWWSVK